MHQPVRRFEFRVKNEHPIDGGRHIQIAAMLNNGLVDVRWSVGDTVCGTLIHKKWIECVEIVEDPETGGFEEREYAHHQT